MLDSLVILFCFIVCNMHCGYEKSISEGQGVQLVGQTVQEYLNSADTYTICDAKGLAITDTSETKGNSTLLLLQ